MSITSSEVVSERRGEDWLLYLDQSPARLDLISPEA